MHFQLGNTFVALNDTGGARPLPVNEDFWPALMSGRLGEVSRLVSLFSFDRNWESWERHPVGEEFVCLLEGEVEFVLEQDGIENSVFLREPGEFVLVPLNTWHTARVQKPSRMLFITPGKGTENRPV
jgi:mannose-6-phosphate isomerase-like protein (cupin superfamily)